MATVYMYLFIQQNYSLTNSCVSSMVLHPRDTMLKQTWPPLLLSSRSSRGALQENQQCGVLGALRGGAQRDRGTHGRGPRLV